MIIVFRFSFAKACCDWPFTALFLFVLLVVWLLRRLLGYEQKKTLREWITTLAQALVISSVLFFALYLFGISLH